ncbi:Amidase signature domain [Sesbania bispinosa]|nr:Amidase signature domain [Sesbania bispinosa]
MATKLSRMFLIVLMILLSGLCSRAQRIPLKEATIRDIQRAFRRNQLTSRELVEFYLGEIERLNPLIHGVIEVNPDALYDAIKADYERKTRAPASFLDLHGIPVLLKDNIATKDKTNTTAADPCGSSSGSGIAAAANLVSVTLATEANGSILCPASYNSVVGIKPTIGLVSQDQVVPITPRQFTVGPITRTVADAVYVLDAIAGFDENDPETAIWEKYIPRRGYKSHLKLNGLKRKRLGIVRNPYFELLNDPYVTQVFEGHFETLRRRGAIVIDNLEIPNISDVLDTRKSGERDLILAEYKVYLNQYLEELDVSPEMIEEFGQDIMLEAQETNGIGDKEIAIMANLEKLSRDGFEKVMKDYNLDAIVTPGSRFYHVLAIGGYPGINVPAGYDNEGIPFGINFGGLKGTEPKLIEIAYGFEQATKIRRPPTFKALKPHVSMPPAERSF